MKKALQKPSKFNIIIIIVISVIMIGIVIYVAGALVKEYRQSGVFRTQVQQKNVSSLYSFYVSNAPTIGEGVTWGNTTSPLTVTVFTDFSCASCQRYAAEVYPLLVQEYIVPGKIMYYHKNYIVAEDADAKKGSFIYAQSLWCFSMLYPSNLSGFYEKLFTTNQSSISKLAVDLGADEVTFQSCVANKSMPSLAQDIAETKKFGIVTPRIYVGIDSKQNTVLQGIPSATQLRNALRNKELVLGR